MNRKFFLLWILALTGCLSAPYLEYQPNSTVELKPSEGLLAVRIKFAANIRYIHIEGNSPGASSFKIDNPKAGFDLRILRLEAGNYCLYRFGGDGWYLYWKDEQRFCFDVKPGTLNYSGDIIEIFRGINTTLNYKGYLAQLQEEHPSLFRQFILAEVR